MTIVNSEKQKRPWYLRKGWVYAMCLVFFPIGIINVLIHRNYWPRDERREYIGILIIMSFLWVWSLLPAHISGLFLLIVFASLMIIGVAQFVRN